MNISLTKVDGMKIIKTNDNNSILQKSGKHLRNESYKNEKLRRKEYLQKNLEDFTASNISLNKKRMILNDKIILSITDRLHMRSDFLLSRCYLSEQCKISILNLLNSFLSSQEAGLEILDITSRRKNLSEEVKKNIFCFSIFVISFFCSFIIFLFLLFLIFCSFIIFLFLLFLMFWMIYSSSVLIILFEIFTFFNCEMENLSHA